jgi:hypothetical protein
MKFPALTGIFLVPRQLQPVSARANQLLRVQRALTKFQRAWRFLPLPEGEGWGEGERKYYTV